ncbi:MAG: hypothetical protein ACLSB9_35420 [Hydrogeniiclostridium mannosilyticum]
MKKLICFIGGIVTGFVLLCLGTAMLIPDDEHPIPNDASFAAKLLRCSDGDPIVSSNGSPQIMNLPDLVTGSILGALGCDMSTFLCAYSQPQKPCMKSS